MGATNRSTAPISMAIAHDPDGCHSGLRLFEPRMTDSWVRLFAEATKRAASTTNHTINQINHSPANGRKQLPGCEPTTPREPCSPTYPPNPSSAPGTSPSCSASASELPATILPPSSLEKSSPPTYVKITRSGRSRHWFSASCLLNL